MFKITIKAKTYAELQTKLAQLMSAKETYETSPTYDTREEDEMLEEAYVHPETAAEEPKRAPKKRSAAPVADVKPVSDETADADAASDSGPFLVTPSSTDGINGVSESNVSQPVGEDADVDSKGMPYSSKIHSATKAKNKDGSWRYRRGVDDAKIKEVEATLSPSIVKSAPSMSGIPPMPTTNVVVPMPFLAPQAPAPIEPTPVAAPVQPAPVAPSVHDPIAPAPNAQKPAHSLETFTSNFVLTIANLLSAGTIDQAYVETLKKHFQVAEIWDIPKEPAKVKEMFESMVNYGMITRVG